jgi:hypothetical protein
MYSTQRYNTRNKSCKQLVLNGNCLCCVGVLTSHAAIITHARTHARSLSPPKRPPDNKRRHLLSSPNFHQDSFVVGGEGEILIFSYDAMRGFTRPVASFDLMKL